MAKQPSPFLKAQFFDANGDPVANGFIYTYLADTTTPATTWQDADGSAENENPVELDAEGRCAIFLTPSVAYKFVLKTAALVTLWTINDIQTGQLGAITVGGAGSNELAGVKSVKSTAEDLVIGTTTSGDVSLEPAGVRTKTAKRFEFGQGANVVAANDTTLGNDGNFFTVTGNTTINGFSKTGWQAGSFIGILFTGTPTLKHNTAPSSGYGKLQFGSGQDLVIVAGMVCNFWFNGTDFYHAGSDLLTPGTSGLRTSKRLQFGYGAGIASTGNLTLGGDGNVFPITGVADVNGIASAGWQAGSVVFLQCGGATIKHGASPGAGFDSFICNGGADITTNANDVVIAIYDGSHWFASKLVA